MKRTWLLRCAIAVALLLGVTARTASAIELGDLRIESKNTGANNYVAVDLKAFGVGSPGIGAWVIDVAYDPSAVSLAGCLPYERGVCIRDFEPNVLRVTGASASGLIGEFTLATLVFRCRDAAGSSDLALAINVWADATVGFPPPPPEGIDGKITCLERGPTAVPTKIPLAGLPATGGGARTVPMLAWLTVVLATLGLGAGAAGVAAARRRV